MSQRLSIEIYVDDKGSPQVRALKGHLDAAGKAGKASGDAIAKGADKAGRELSRMDGEARGLDRTFAALHGRLDGFAGRILNVKTGLAGLGLGAILAADIKAAEEFERKIRDLGRVGVTDLEKVRAGLLTLPPELGRASQLADAYYQSVSAGAADGAEAMALLTTASQAAAAAYVDQSAMIEAQTSILAGYAMSYAEAATAADLLYTIERQGKTTVAQLVPVIGQVSAASAALGVELNEMGAGLAAITMTSGGTSEAATQYKAVIQSLANPQEDMAKGLAAIGYQSAEAAIQSEGLGGTLAKLRTYADASGVGLAKLLGSSEAFQGALAITSNDLERYNANLGVMRDKTGAAQQAWEAYTESGRNSGEAFRAALDRVAIAVGDKLLPGMIDLTDRATDWIAANDELLTQDLPGYIEDVVDILPTLLRLLGETVEGWAALDNLVRAGAGEWRAAWELEQQKHFNKLRAEAAAYREDMDRLFGAAITPQWATQAVDEDILAGMERLVELEEAGRTASGERAQRMVREYQELKRSMRELIEEREKILDDATLQRETDQAVKLYGEVEDAITRTAEADKARARVLAQAAEAERRNADAEKRREEEAKRRRDQTRKEREAQDKALLDQLYLWKTTEFQQELDRLAQLDQQFREHFAGRAALLEEWGLYHAQQVGLALAAELEANEEMAQSYEGAVERKLRLDAEAAARQAEQAKETGEVVTDIHHEALEEQRRQAEQAYNEFQNDFNRLFVDGLAGGLRDSKRDWDGYLDSIIDAFADALVSMATTAILNPIVTPMIYQTVGGLLGYGGGYASGMSGGYTPGGAQASASMPYVGGAGVAGSAGGGVDWMGLASAGKSAYGLISGGLYATGQPLSGGLFGMASTGGLLGTILPGTGVSVLPAGGYAALTSGGLAVAGGLPISTALGLGALGGMGYSMLGPLVGLPQGQYSGITASLGGALGAWGGGALAGSSLLAGTGIATALGGMILPVVGALIGAIAGGLLGSLGGTSHHQGTASVLVGATSWDWGETGFDVSPGSDQVEYVSGASLEDAELVTDYLNDVAQASYDTIDAMVQGTPRAIRDNLQDSLSQMTIEFGRHNGWGSLGDIDFEEDIEAQLQAAGEDLADRIMAAAAEGLAKGMISALESGDVAATYQVVQADWDSMTSGNGVILGNAMWEEMRKYAEGVDPEDGEDALNAVQEWLEKLGQMNALFLEIEKNLDISGVDFLSGFEMQMMSLEAGFDNWLDQLEELGFAEEYIAKVEAQRADYLAEQAELIKQQAQESLDARRMALEGGHGDELARMQYLTSSQGEMLAAIEQWAGLDKTMSGMVGDFYDMLASGDHAGAYAIMQQLEASFADMGEEGQFLIQILHLLTDEFNDFAAEQEKAWEQANQQLDMRYLTATGQDWEAQQMAFAIQQQEEYAAAVDAGADEAYLAKLAMVQLAESAAFLAARAQAVADFNGDLQVRLLQATGKDLEAQLLAFDLSAAKQREEAEALGADLALLEETLYAERLKLVQDYNAQVIQEYESAAEAITGQLGGVRDYLTGLYTGDKTILTPLEQIKGVDGGYQGTESQFWEEYQKIIDNKNAEVGSDQYNILYNAMQGITGYAETYLSEARSMYASSPEYVRIFEEVSGALEGLTSMSAEQYLADVITAAIGSQTQTLTGNGQGDLGTVSGKLGLLDVIRGYLDADDDGSLTFAEFMTAVQGNPRSFAEAFISQYDTSRAGTPGYGYLSWDEVSAVLSADLWNAFNANNDSYLSAAELEKMFVSGEGTAILEKMFHAWDSNGDGILSTEDTDSPLKSAALETNQILTVQAMLLTAIVDNTWSTAQALGAQQYSVDADGMRVLIGPSTSQDVTQWLDDFPTLLQWQNTLSGTDRSGTVVSQGGTESVWSSILEELQKQSNIMLDNYSVNVITAVNTAGIVNSTGGNVASLWDTYFGKAGWTGVDLAYAYLHKNHGGGIGVPMYADGGYHAGGLRLVGEEGPELEVTGPARYWTYEQTKDLLAERPTQAVNVIVDTKALADVMQEAMTDMLLDGQAAAKQRGASVRLLGRIATDVGSIRKTTTLSR